MSSIMDQSIEFPRKVLAGFALEVWRLSRLLEQNKDGPNAIGLRYSISKLMQLLDTSGISFVDITGQQYDAGMAVDILDTEGEKTEETTFYVKEMIAPIILIGDKFLTHGQVILERKTNADKSKSNKEGATNE